MRDKQYGRGRIVFLWGMCLLYLSFIRLMAAPFGFVNLLYYSGRLLSVAGVAAMFVGTFMILCSNYYKRNVVVPKTWRFVLLLIYPIWLFFYGFLCRNNASVLFCGTEMLAMVALSCFIVVGAVDDMWQYLNKPMVFMFYITVFLALCTYTIEDPFKDVESMAGVDIESLGPERYTGSLAYRAHSLLGWGLVLSVLGLTKSGKKNWVQRLAIFAIIPYLLIEVALFKFRSAFVSLLILHGMLFAKRLFSKKSATYLTGFAGVMLAAIIVGLWVSEEEVSAFAERLQETTESGLFETFKRERWTETEILLRQLSLGEMIFGRGAGGHYDASEFFGQMGKEWFTAHIGISGLVLKGGFVYVVILLMQIFTTTRSRNSSVYDEMASLSKPYILWCFIMLPFAFVADQILSVAFVALILGRYYSRPNQSPYVDGRMMDIRNEIEMRHGDQVDREVRFLESRDGVHGRRRTGEG